jgi:hypothetical protein
MEVSLRQSSNPPHPPLAKGGNSRHRSLLWYGGRCPPYILICVHLRKSAPGPLKKPLRARPQTAFGRLAVSARLRLLPCEPSDL